jgi:SpoIID/LytB domain protein
MTGLKRQSDSLFSVFGFLHSALLVPLLFALNAKAEITQPKIEAAPDRSVLDTLETAFPETELRASGDTLPQAAPFPEAQDSTLLRFPYRAEFLSAAWDSLAQSVAAQAAAAAAKAQKTPGIQRGAIPVAKLPGALTRAVRVLLKREAAAITLNLRSEFGLAKLNGSQAIPQAFVVTGNTTVRIKAADLEITDAGGTRLLRGCGGIRLIPAHMGAYFELGGFPYRGSLDLVAEPASTQLVAVNVVPMEDYLRGVLPYELGHVDATGSEALKSLAVVARTYAMRRMLRPASARFDLYADVQDQVYKGMKDEYAFSDLAVRDTRGQVLLYADTLVQAFYHSTCGGRTANREDVWDGGPIPYLTSRDDHDPQGRPWCAASPLLNWQQSWSLSDLSGILKRNFSAGRAQGNSDFQKIQGFSITEKAVCGRIKFLTVETDKGPVLLKGDRVRWALKPIRSDGRILESAHFDLDLQGDKVTASGIGFGHGIGLCQYGAIGRSKAGQSFREILAAYFQGTRIVEYR